MNIRFTRAALARMFAFSALSMLLSLVCFRLAFNLSSATSVHLFLVALIAVRYGLLEATVVSIVSAGCLDFFFTDPIFRFSISDYRNWVALATFEAAALLIATLSNRAIARAAESELHQARLDRMYQFSQSILLLNRKSAVEQQLADLIRSSLEVDAVALWNAGDLVLSQSGAVPFNDREVRSIYFGEINRDDLAGATSTRVLRQGTRATGALILKGHTLDAHSVNAVAAIVSVAVERAASFHSEASALAASQSERLRSAILDGLAHSFKSPLTAIISSSSGLLAMNTLAGTEHSLVQLIDQQATTLADLTHHLLLTAKLDTENVTLHTRQVDLRELVTSTARTLEAQTINLEAEPGSRFLAEVDEALVRLALTQVLDNAAKYGAPNAPISVGLNQTPHHLNIAVRNQGSYIPKEDWERVFDRFYRCESSARNVSGTGIGLAVVKRIAEAHRGYASVSSDRMTGTTFTIALPRTLQGTH